MNKKNDLIKNNINHVDKVKKNEYYLININIVRKFKIILTKINKKNKIEIRKFKLKILRRENVIMKNLEKNLIAKLYSFYYLFFWGFYFSASYFVCKNKYNSFQMGYYVS